MSLASQAYKTKELGDICEFLSGGTPSKDREDYWGGDVPWVTARDLKTTHLEETGLRLTAAGARTLKCAPQGAIVILVRGMTLFKDIPVAVLRKPMCFNQDIKALVVDAEHDGMFVAYQLIARKSFIQRLVDSAGHGTGRLDTGLLKAVPLRFPTLPEQQKIAGFLGAVDAKLAALAARQAALGRFKAGLMQKLFSQQLRFTRDDGSAFPDWQEKRLGEVFTWVKTNSLSREFLTHDGGEVQNIHYGDIHTKFRPLFRQSFEAVPFVGANSTLKPFTDDEYCRVGDVVIADASEDYADIGKAIEIVEVRERSLVAGLHTYIARPKIGSLVVGFSGYLLRSAPMRQQIIRIAQGISVLGVSKGNLEKLTFWIPHPDEQAKIAGALSAMDAKIQAVADQVAKLQTFKKGLLQQMFV
ncbi:restriction endonuclease subunit S [Roseovarius sp. MBR-6]|jgi:restriction endonuclease S subunit|uniref:restriction endonuclease subunit S n=1 Tax=Roseovarius sp. MBR-6 TaxID=3156459 RepID=UPI00339B4752